MQIERGVEKNGTRIRLILNSADVHTHSLLSDQAEVFNQYATQIQEFAQKLLDEAAFGLALTAKEKLQ